MNGKRNAWESSFIPFLYFSKIVRAWCQCWVLFFFFSLHLERECGEKAAKRAARGEGWRLVNERVY